MNVRHWEINYLRTPTFLLRIDGGGSLYEVISVYNNELAICIAYLS